MTERKSASLLEIEAAKGSSPFLMETAPFSVEANMADDDEDEEVTQLRKEFEEQRKEGKLKTYPLPQSSVLDKVRAFLPQMQLANAELQQAISRQGREAVDIEHVDDDEPQHIELDLMMGFLEAKVAPNSAEVASRTSAFLGLAPGSTAGTARKVQDISDEPDTSGVEVFELSGSELSDLEGDEDPEE